MSLLAAPSSGPLMDIVSEGPQIAVFVGEGSMCHTLPIAERLDNLERSIACESPSTHWRGPARVGDRVRWYLESHEVAHRGKDG